MVEQLVNYVSLVQFIDFTVVDQVGTSNVEPVVITVEKFTYRNEGSTE